jgi:hypothetical protein
VKVDWGGQTVAATNGVGKGDEIEAHLGGNSKWPNPDFGIWYNGSAWGNSGFTTGSEVPTTVDHGYWLGATGDPTDWSPLFTLVFEQFPASGNPDAITYVLYQTGTYNGGQLEFGNGQGTVDALSHGFYPSIAEGTTNGHRYFIEVQNGEDTGSAQYNGPNPTLEMVVGELNSDGISIHFLNGDSPTSFGNGWFPTVAMWPINSNSFFVAVAYQEQEENSEGPLDLKVGQWTVGSSTINWTASYPNYAIGGSPSIAICARDRNPAVLIETHGVDGVLGAYTWAPIEGAWTTLPGPWHGDSIGYFGASVIQPRVACNTYSGFESHNDSSGTIWTTKCNFE